MKTFDRVRSIICKTAIVFQQRGIIAKSIGLAPEKREAGVRVNICCVVALEAMESRRVINIYLLLSLGLSKCA